MPTAHRFEARVRAAALSFPATREDLPWGHSAIKVGGKTFVFLSKDEPSLSLSVKLPYSAEGVLQLPGTEPTHYGLGRSGWVTITFAPRARPDLEAIRSWLTESYQAVAPKKLLRAEGGASSKGATKAKRASRSTSTSRAKPKARPGTKTRRSRAG